MTAGKLPVAEPVDVRRAAARLVRADGRGLATALGTAHSGGHGRPAGRIGPWGAVTATDQPARDTGTNAKEDTR
ncbi:hypothetical protein [Streptomyces sp. V3I7]|uniref:hypothetical protein n=1 Tax=Streptomyces sp. V3I7 TaxID=3042278 RepID=UPI00277D1B68|nr:hypothetical protein [Streptomyces sp. V3I7]MDQ0993149.1 hypothetical protein [Streptomyces sp. V3I7]